MKKIIITVATIIALLCVLVLAGCEHEHEWSDWKTAKEPTCTENGVEERACKCGEKETKEITKLDHIRGDWVIDAEPTCTSDGAEHLSCTVCSEVIVSGPIPATGHTDGEWITDTEATCTTDGSKHQICSVCNETIKTETIAATGHTDGEWIIDVDATCTTDGSKHQVCSVCEASIKTEAIAATGHTDGEWIIDVDATCTTDGSRHQVCPVCKDTAKTEVITKLGHSKETLIWAGESEGCFYASWFCDMCEDSYIEEFQAISAYFSFYINYGVYPQYTIDVSTSGGIGKYTYQYIVYDRYSGAILDTQYTENNSITYTDYTQSSITDNNLVLRVFINDSVGEIIIDVPINDGYFSTPEENTIVSAYVVYKN